MFCNLFFFVCDFSRPPHYGNNQQGLSEGSTVSSGLHVPLNEAEEGSPRSFDCDWVTDQIEELWLWHRRLGHPSFSVIKKLMPTLFFSTDESKLHCESCVLAKSHRTS